MTSWRGRHYRANRLHQGGGSSAAGQPDGPTAAQNSAPSAQTAT